MAKVLVVYSTKTGTTEAMAESLAEGLRETGTDATVIDAKDVKGELDMAGYDVYLFGSPTYHHEMIEDMKRLLLVAERADLQGKTGGVFGAYGWSGESLKKMHEKMEYRCGMEMLEDRLPMKVPIGDEALRRASREFGRKLGGRISGRE